MSERPERLSEGLLSKSSTAEHLSTFHPIDLKYTDLEVVVKSKKETKTIIHKQSGVMNSGTFTAILGPSGSGKTTLLNFLSGRLVSTNLRIEGGYELNGIAISSVEPYANQIAYIMQDDILLETMTPRESLMFAASMRLQLSKVRRERRVNTLIEQLGLSDCCDTKIGSTMKKGISGGERKRTSIGIELITDPSIIFLDEPTTGLDSTTALQVVQLLRNLANEGRTVVSTIHQPSSEVFYQFDRLLLIVEGHCIFKGNCSSAEDHFRALGYECPAMMNLAEFYMDMMSLQVEVKEGDDETSYSKAKQDHESKIAKLQEDYRRSDYYRNNLEMREGMPPLVKNDLSLSVGGCKQFSLLFQRAFFNQIRNPMDTTLKLIQAIFLAGVIAALFGRLVTTDKMTEEVLNFRSSILQSIRGALFFLTTYCCMSGTQGTLATFSSEKPMFLRERFSNTYSTWSYFWARSLANLPFQIFFTIIPAVIVFYGVGLNNNNSPDNFLMLLLIMNLMYFLAASYGLFYSALIPKLEVAMALVPVLIIPFMMLSGFFRDLNKVSEVFYPFEYLSPFRYGFQAVMLNEFHGKPYRHNLQNSYTPNTLDINLYVLLGIGVLLRGLAFLMLYKISNPKRPRINRPTEQIVR